MPLRIDGVNAMSQDFSRGKQVIKFGSRSNGTQWSLFILSVRLSRSLRSGGWPQHTRSLTRFYGRNVRNLPLMLSAHEKKKKNSTCGQVCVSMYNI